MKPGLEMLKNTLVFSAFLVLDFLPVLVMLSLMKLASSLLSNDLQFFGVPLIEALAVCEIMLLIGFSIFATIKIILRMAVSIQSLHQEYRQRKTDHN